jgi:hypothetical protein
LALLLINYFTYNLFTINKIQDDMCNKKITELSIIENILHFSFPDT